MYTVADIFLHTQAQPVADLALAKSGSPKSDREAASVRARARKGWWGAWVGRGALYVPQGPSLAGCMWVCSSCGVEGLASTRPVVLVLGFGTSEGSFGCMAGAGWAGGETSGCCDGRNRPGESLKWVVRRVIRFWDEW